MRLSLSHFHTYVLYHSMRIFSVLWLLPLVWGWGPSAGQATDSPPLDVVLTVKENADVGAKGYPISAVFPLPEGQYFTADSMGIQGAPSQVAVVERWPGDDSLRHVLVHFQPSVESHGDSTYHFTQQGAESPAIPVVVTDATSMVTVNTGPLQFVVSKARFNILDHVWLDQDLNGSFESGEELLSSNLQNGGVFTPREGAGSIQYDTARTDVTVEIEESGPLYAVIRVEAPARFVSTTDHTHGFAVRIHAYAGKPFIKVDYQLQNSVKDVVRSWPLYLEAMDLDFALNLSSASTLRFGLTGGTVYEMTNSEGAYLAQEMHNTFKIYNQQTKAVLHDSGVLPDGTGPEGYVDIVDTQRGVMAAIRNFWQTWPNGLAVDSQNRLSLQLLPDWSAQWYANQFSPSGLYWIEDMQHHYKEVLLFFHGPGESVSVLTSLARTFQFPPVAVVSTDWYRETKATLDLGGVIPPAEVIPAVVDQRRPLYSTIGFNVEDWYDESGPYYGAGWVNFYDPEPGYRSGSCMHGGWPYCAGGLLASGNPGDYFTAEGWAMGELNLRPEWMTGYTHTADWARLQLTENPYCGGRWRIFEGHGISKLAATPLSNTGTEEPVYFSRDDQHAWFYHVAEAYWLTGNPWIKDWYEFIAEFRQICLHRLDPFPDTSSRAIGHSLSHVLQAYRVTGNLSLLESLQNHIRLFLRPSQDPLYGDQLLTVEDSGGGFQTGFLARFVVDYLEEVRAQGDWQAYAEAFCYLSGLIEWNYHYGNFPYYFNAREGGSGVSSGTSLTWVDPQAWYYWHTGKQSYHDQLLQYMSVGLNGGEPAYGEFSQWTGQFEGRYYLYVENTSREDTTPPLGITDLSAVLEEGVTQIRWTAPTGAARYLIVWSTQTLVEAHSASSAVTNWWAGNPIGPDLLPNAGERQSWTIDTGDATPVYVAMFSFDTWDNMSAMSNVALARPQGEAGAANWRLY